MSNNYRFSQAPVNDFFSNGLPQIDEDDSAMEESCIEYPLGRKKRVAVLLTNNVSFNERNDGHLRNHKRFELFSDSEMGLGAQAHIFEENLVESVRVNLKLYSFLEMR